MPFPIRCSSEPVFLWIPVLWRKARPRLYPHEPEESKHTDRGRSDHQPCQKREDPKSQCPMPPGPVGSTLLEKHPTPWPSLWGGLLGGPLSKAPEEPLQGPVTSGQDVAEVQQAHGGTTTAEGPGAPAGPGVWAELLPAATFAETAGCPCGPVPAAQTLLPSGATRAREGGRAPFVVYPVRQEFPPTKHTERPCTETLWGAAILL